MQRTLYDQDHEDFRDVVREFVAREVVPHQERWETERLIDRGVWTAAGKQGLLALAAPEEHGGGGQADFRYRAVMMEEFARVGAASLGSAFSVQDDIVLPYLLDLGTKEQKQRWLPGICAGETVTAIAMTEPGAGSDVQGIRTTAVRDGDHWVLDGGQSRVGRVVGEELLRPRQPAAPVQRARV
ncbi:acyl-CoA dehydrogenase family protein, partial [Streptomyces sp. NPDC002143]